MAKQALRELYVDELRDLYDAENRLVKALPKLAKEAESIERQNGLSTQQSRSLMEEAITRRYTAPER